MDGSSLGWLIEALSTTKNFAIIMAKLAGAWTDELGVGCELSRCNCDEEEGLIMRRYFESVQG